MSSKVLKDLKDLIISHNKIDCELATIDELTITSDYSDQYYTKIDGNPRKATLKTIYTIDVDTRLILNYSANKGPKYDTEFAIAPIKTIKKI